MMRRDHNRAALAERALARQRRAGDTRSMANGLDHLPAGKRRELAFVTELLREEFAKALSTRQSKTLKAGQILHVILFGSYARGDWVEDPVGRYFSDYDLLVVVNDERLTDILEFWDEAEKRLLAELSAGTHLRTPVNFIVHSLADVNAQLERGRYFFVDIAREGIPLFEVPGHPFVEPHELSAATALEEAQGYYEDCRESVSELVATAEFAIQKGYSKKAAFLLHQAAETLYTGLLLVLTHWTPKSHNLVRLRGLAEPLDPRLAAVWPTETKFQRRCFELLRAAYVKARYSRQYKVTAEELTWIRERVEALQTLVLEICRGRIAELTAKQATATPRD